MLDLTGYYEERPSQKRKYELGLGELLVSLLDAEDFARIEIVSGAGARERVSTVTHIPSTIFAHAVEGFVVLDFGLRDGEEVVVARVIEPSSPVPVFEMDVP